MWACPSRRQVRQRISWVLVPATFYALRLGTCVSTYRYLRQLRLTTRPTPCIAAGEITHLSAFFSNYYRHCTFPGDYLGHGWKEFVTSWKEGFRKDMAKDLTSHDSLEPCRPLSVEDEFRVARDCCFTHYPGCKRQDGINVCYDRSKCPRDPNWW